MAGQVKRHRVVGEYEYNGVVYQQMVPRDIIEQVKYRFPLRDDDVMVATYPKAGTTWVQEIVWLLMNNGDVTKARETLQDIRVPFLELDISKTPRFIDIVDKAESPRIFKTHLGFDFFSEQLAMKKTKVVFGARNIKDTLVSFYHFYRMNDGYGNMTGPFNEFFEIFREKKLVYGDWFDYNLHYWNNRDKFNFFLVKYEDLHKDFYGTVKNLAKFLGKELSDEQFEAIAKHVSFAEMKENKMVNKTIYPSLQYKISPFMRKGTVGDWKNYLTEEQNEYIDKLYKEKIEGTGLEFNFEIE